MPLSSQLPADYVELTAQAEQRAILNSIEPRPASTIFPSFTVKYEMLSQLTIINSKIMSQY